MTRVVDNIFLGSFALAQGAEFPAFLRDNHIRCVINCTKTQIIMPVGCDITHLQLFWDDMDLYDMQPPSTDEHIELITKYIIRAEDACQAIAKHENVIIFCQECLDRSPFMVAYYLIRKRGYKYGEARKKLKEVLGYEICAKNQTMRSILAEMATPLPSFS